MTRLRPLLVCFVMLASAALAQTDPIPFISQLYPTSTYPGHAAFTMDISGANFTSGVVVNWNGSPRATTYLSSDHLQAAITAADVAHANTGNVTVVNPGSIASKVAYFPVGPSSSAVAFARYDMAVTYGGGGPVIGDFNNDGELDVAVEGCTNPCNLGTLTYLGNGDGTFQPPLMSNCQTPVLAGDLDGDGILDLVSYVPDGFTTFCKGNGDGTFSQIPGSVGGFIPAALADVNHDGKLDLIASLFSRSTGSLQVFLGNGDFTFTPSWNVGLGCQGGGGLATVGDFNRDGKLDLAATSACIGQTYLTVYLGNGDGTFSEINSNSCSSFELCAMGDIRASDLNNDGKLDLVTDGGIVYLGNGDGTFTGPTVEAINASGVQLADLDNDNKPDIAATLPNGTAAAGIGVLLGDGDGIFQNPQIWDTGFNSAVPPGVGDFNNDGRLDTVSGRFSQQVFTLEIFLQTALNISPTFLNFGTVKVGTTSAPQTVTLTNIGNKNLYIGPIQVSGDTTNFKGTSNCGNLAAGLSCIITGTFTPSSQKTFSASVQVNYIGTVGSPQVIEVTGTGD